jgi:hypothetical protein
LTAEKTGSSPCRSAYSLLCLAFRAQYWGFRQNFSACGIIAHPRQGERGHVYQAWILRATVAVVASFCDPGGHDGPETMPKH